MKVMQIWNDKLIIKEFPLLGELSFKCSELLLLNTLYDASDNICIDFRTRRVQMLTKSLDFFPILLSENSDPSEGRCM